MGHLGALLTSEGGCRTKYFLVVGLGGSIPLRSGDEDLLFINDKTDGSQTN